ncbi:CHAP domain-containing protein [Streptomyces sp. CBMA29]|uniref:CHAP domain-containing protein n=1 Tax=Streptomyces sp. CBMA29 TaxID=1896314 RepID=UPI001661DDF8|nr:CHAP domain-containing protein [Streptomyces sp. CBMA29]MBD0740123.1 hypothetical protein [Streptomyces sp. CBMA29]
MPPALPRLKNSAIAISTAVAAVAVAGLTALPARADTPSNIAAAVNSQVGYGPSGSTGAGYSNGVSQTNSTHGQSWCADFAGWAWAQGGGVKHLSTLDDGAASFYNYGQDYDTLSNTPAVGDAVVFSYSASSDWAKHVEIVTAVSGSTITAVGGNENGQVERDTFTHDAVGTSTYNGTISGYVAPAYTATTPPAAPVYSGDVPLAGKWAGGYIATIGVYRPSTGSGGTFYLRDSNTAGTADSTISLGSVGDVPITGDWSNVGHTQVGVYRPSTRAFYLRLDNGNTTQWKFGDSGDTPITGNWDGAGGTGIGVFRVTGHTNTFFLRHADATVTSIAFGSPGDMPITGDWDGTGTTQVGVFRPSTGSGGTFYLRHANGTTTSFSLGNSGDLPVLGDWEGNGKTEAGLYRPSNANFYLDKTTGITTIHYGNGGTWS